MSENTPPEGTDGELGNTIDGTRPGDGGGAAGSRADSSGGGGHAKDAHAADREAEKDVYVAPDDEGGSAVGGPDGTADGH